MPTFRVLVREVWVTHVLVEADNADQAKSKVAGTVAGTDAADSAGEHVFDEYSHTLPSDTWTVEEHDADEETEPAHATLVPVKHPWIDEDDDGA